MTTSRAAALSACAALALAAFAAAPLSVRAFDIVHTETVEPPQGWFWGSVDANVDWCERNYVTTEYVAEFWNALSSLPITLFAVIGYLAGKKYARAETRFTVGWAWMMIVGLGSFAFHATLRRYAQCMDELPMLYASITLFYNTLDHAPGAAYATPAGAAAAMRRQGGESPWAAVQYRIGLKIALITAGAVLTYIYFQLPALFQVFFLGYSTFLMSFVALMGYHIFCGPRNQRRGEVLQSGSNGYEAVPLDSLAIHGGAADDSGAGSAASAAAAHTNATRPFTPVLGRLFYLALAGYFGGFVFWLYENTFCETLAPWMQFHALWHIMAGLGTFSAIQCQIAWRAEEMGGRTSIDRGLGMKVLPVVVVKYDNVPY